MQTEEKAEEYIKNMDFVIFFIKVVEMYAVMHILHCAFCV